MTRILLVSFAASLALAQQAPHPRQTHIEVPDPLADEMPQPAPAEEVAPEAAAADAAPPAGGGVAVRREPRVATGVPPTSLSGRFAVVQVTEGGETEDFRVKMDRAGKALHQDCITVSMLFDFGAAQAPGLPNRVRVVERQECYKGGLGRYLNEMALDLPVTWSQSDGGVVMTVPEVRATAGLVRLRKPEAEGLGTAPQWLGPETKVERGRTDYAVLAEPPKGRKAEGVAALHLTAGHQVLHLEPATEGGPFGD